jgi:plasmid maintenance system antidote protein VapI
MAPGVYAFASKTGHDPQLWVNLQSACGLAVAEREKGERISKEVIPAQSQA